MTYQPDEFDRELLEDQAPGRPMLRADKALPEQLDIALNALRKDQRLFWQDGRLVLEIDGQVKEVARGTLAVMLEKRCYVHKLVGKNPVPIPCRPDETLLAALLGLPTPGPLRPLVSVRSDPVVGPDGRQLPPGYDAASRQLVRPCDVQRGGHLRDLLADLLGDYPEPARAAWLAAVVGQLARAHYPTQPGWVIDANQPRAGKTTLAQLACVSLCGREASIGALPRDEAEIGKQLAARCASRPIVVWDNVTHQLASDTLEAYLSSEEWTYRPLGGSSVSTIRSDALMAFSANGAQARRDMADRCMITRLDRPPGAARWKHRDPIGRALALRPRVLGAILDAIELHAARGFPEPTWQDLGRNQGWNRWARGLAYSVYGVDVLEYRGAVDAESDQLELLIGSLASMFELGQCFTVSQVLHGDMNEAREDVRRAIATLANKDIDRVDERIAGVVFGRYEGRWAGNVRLIRLRDPKTRRLGWAISQDFVPSP